jgi:2-methylcitrate dehydratase PrpD
MKSQCLDAKLKDDEIIIRVGIDTIKWALEHHIDSQPYNEETNQYDQKWIVVDSLEFAQDVLRAMYKEEEDGTTPLIEFLEKMCMEALDDGSLGINDVPKGTIAIDI